MNQRGFENLKGAALMWVGWAILMLIGLGVAAALFAVAYRIFIGG